MSSFVAHAKTKVMVMKPNQSETVQLYLITTIKSRCHNQRYLRKSTLKFGQFTTKRDMKQGVGTAEKDTLDLK